MTAPGNATLLIAILAVFLGCTGYAAGRLHQWYRTGLDRDEAYRDGYDTGTRRTFSMAARIIGPRRDKTGIRASASVHAARARSGTASPVLPTPVSTAFPAPPAFEFPDRPAPARLSPEVWSAAGSPPASAVSSADAAAADPAASDGAKSTVSPKPHRRGRHFVPDELVRAVTYRLAPDRVARAKVRQAKRAPEAAPDEAAVPRPGSKDGPVPRSVSDEDPAPRRSLPKPRSS